MSAKKKSIRARSRVGTRLVPLRVSSAFREFVLEQLSALRDLYPRSMFGGIGLYSDGVFFGIVAGDVLYLKVDESTRHDYEQAGSRAFQPYADRPVTMMYYSVPLAILEDATSLVQWARRAIAVAEAGTSARRRSGRAVTRLVGGGRR